MGIFWANGWLGISITLLCVHKYIPVLCRLQLFFQAKKQCLAYLVKNELAITNDFTRSTEKQLLSDQVCSLHFPVYSSKNVFESVSRFAFDGITISVLVILSIIRPDLSTNCYISEFR